MLEFDDIIFISAAVVLQNLKRMLLLFTAFVVRLESAAAMKINAPSCSDVPLPPTNRKLHIAACESRWGPEVSDVYNTTSQIMVRNAAAKGNLVISNVCANLNWKKLGFLTKPLKYLDYAKKLMKEETETGEKNVIIFSDSDTFWAVDSVEDILRKYDCIREGKDIVMATETSCWVGRYCIQEDMDNYYAHKAAPGYSAFVNSGLLIGTPKALTEMFSDIVRKNASSMIPKYKGTMKYDDQMAFVQYYSKNLDKVALDYHQHLFGSIVTSHKSSRTHKIPFVCVKQDAGPSEDVYDFNCDDLSSKAFRMGAQKMDPQTCKYIRYPEAVKPDPEMYEVYRTLAPDPVIWHGNGAGKRTYGWMRTKLHDCFSKNYGI